MSGRFVSSETVNRTVVFIHGQPGDSGDFESVLGRLPAYVNVFTYDRPGWGQNNGEVTDLAGNSAYLVGLLRACQVGDAILVGYSYGSAVALRAAIDFPDLISGLVLISPVGNLASISGIDAFLAVGAGFVTRVHFPWRSRDKKQRRVVESFYGEQIRLQQDLASLSRGASSLRLPIDLVVGLDDFFNPLRGTLRLRDSLAGGRMSIIKGAGHLLLDQVPEIIAQRVFSMWSARSER